MAQVGNDFVGCVLLASNCCFVVGVGPSTSLGIEYTASAVDVVSGVYTRGLSRSLMIGGGAPAHFDRRRRRADVQ